MEEVIYSQEVEDDDDGCLLLPLAAILQNNQFRVTDFFVTWVK